MERPLDGLLPEQHYLEPGCSVALSCGLLEEVLRHHPPVVRCRMLKKGALIFKQIDVPDDVADLAA